MRHFADQVVIVTGASSGIGRALALELAADRACLVLAARNRERLEQVAADCHERGGQSLVVPTDVSVESQCAALAAQTIDKFGRIDALVNNAGHAMWARFDQLTDLKVIEDLMRVNFLGSVYCTHYALPHLKNTRGRLVVLASTSGLTGVPWLSGYAASKHALVGFFESLRIELADSGVSVTVAAPDFVQSEILERAADAQGQPLRYSPLDQKKLLSAERCAHLIVRGMRKRKRLVLTSERSKNLRWGKLLVPRLVDRWVAAAVGWK